MKIIRKRLAAAFATFEGHGHGVVIGAPGVGKTHLLVEHFRAAKTAGRSVVLLQLDKHSVHTDRELQDELGLDRGLVDILHATVEATASNPGLLIIDSYDALRSENAQTYVRVLIRRAQNVLQARWRIIVAVRTFDATRSETLLELFPAVGGRLSPEFELPGVQCRHFSIPLLSADETREAVTTIAGLDGVYERSSSAFRELLSIPFNLWLAEKLLNRNVDPDALSEVSSEVQLLSLFWSQRVSTGLLSLRRRSVLTEIARAMIEARQLSRRIDSLYKRSDDQIWQDLLSADILTTAGTADQRVSFAHNILFDFAVSVLLLEDEPVQVAAFLTAEPARPVFLRPSINYYFTRLWFENRDVFWNVAWFLLSNEQIELRLFGRLIPTAVIVREARTVADLSPIFRALDARDRAAPHAVHRLLQARRALKARRQDMWLSAFEQLTRRFDRRFAWDLTVQTHDAVASGATTQALESAGRTARAIMSFVWSIRPEQPWADALGAAWATRLVVRTYCTDPASSQALLRPILESIGDTTLSVEYSRHIASQVEAIWTCDPAFVAEIYELLLGHKETSTATTRMGTPVVPMTSNRRQDFQMCVYELIKHFDSFLAANEAYALSGGIAAVDRFVARDHVDPYLNEGHTVEDMTRRFQAWDCELSYVDDHSESWRASGYQDEELQIADRIFQYIERAAEGAQSEVLDTVVRVFAKHARMAFWWAGLLDIAARYPVLFSQRLLPLCIAEPVLSGSPTVKQVTAFVAAAYTHWKPSQRAEFEQTVLALRRDGNDEQWRTLRHQRLLGLIPVDLIATDQARGVRAEMAQAALQPSNDPLDRFTVSGAPFGEPEWLQEEGADLEKPANHRLREAAAPLGVFRSSWQNSIPTHEAVNAILPAMEESLRLLADNGGDPPVVSTVRTDVTTAAMLAARTVTPADSAFRLVRATLLDAARNPLFGESDEPRNEDTDFPAWSSRPETEAAQGLPWIALRQRDDEALGAIEALSRNPDAIVRYLVVSAIFRISGQAPECFWNLIDERIANDNAPLVRLGICQSLARVTGGNRERFVDAVCRLWETLPLHRSQRHDFRDLLLDIVIWLRVEGDDAWARQTLDNLTAEPLSDPSLLQAAVRKLWHKVIPSELASHRPVVDIAFNLVSEAVNQTCRVLAARDHSRDECDAEQLKSLYDVIDLSVAHVHFCMSRTHSRDASARPEDRQEFFALVSPLLDTILNFGLDRGFVLAPTAHFFMEILNEVVAFDARSAVIMASRAARASEGSNYNIDSLAAGKVVQLVERVLADHRSEVQDAEALQALMDLLDVFAATGWPAAIQLVWRLDDLFR